MVGWDTKVTTKSLAFLEELVHTFSLFCVCEYTVTHPHNRVYVAHSGITSCFHLFSEICGSLKYAFFNKWFLSCVVVISHDFWRFLYKWISSSFSIITFFIRHWNNFYIRNPGILTVLLSWSILGQNKAKMKQIFKNEIEKIMNHIFVCVLGKKKGYFFLIILKTINQEEHYRKAGFWHAKCEPQKSHFCFRQCKENNSLISEEKLLEDCTLSLSFQLASCQPNQLRDFAKQSITW